MSLSKKEIMAEIVAAGQIPHFFVTTTLKFLIQLGV